MATTSTSWMPAQGKVPVKVGTSLNRALKARKQGGTPPATVPKRLPDKDFYSFRYNFKPPAIDSTKPGTIEVKKGKEKTQVVVEHSSSQAGEVYVFAGTETSKELDVVLIYDDETGEYTLEKLDSVMNLTWERKRSTGARAPSPVAPSPSDLDAEGENDEDLEKELLDLTEDIPLAKAIKQRPSQPPPRPPPQRKEEEEEEEIPIPPVQNLPPKPSKQQSSTKSAARSTKPIPKARPSAAASAELAPPPVASNSQPAAPSTQKKLKKRKELEPPERQSDPDVEVLAFGKPAKRAKAPAASAAPSQVAPPPPTSFALPGTEDSGFFQPPPAPAPPPTSKPSKGAQPPAAPVAPAADSEEDSEGDWEEVANAEPVPRALSYHSDEGDVGDGLFGDEDGEADPEDELANQLDAELGGDFLEAALTEAPSSKEPLSWSQLAAAQGGVVDDSEDDFSSSDDSDDD